MSGIIDMTNDAPRVLSIEFGKRIIPCRHADETTLSIFECPNCGPKHAFVTLAFMTDQPSQARGRFVSMTPDQAREYAAALVELANEIDGGARQ